MQQWLLHIGPLLPLSGQIWVIANPASGRGKGSRTLSQVRAALKDAPDLTIRETSAPGDEEEIATDALRSGANTIVSVGGDGTCNKVAQVLIRTGSDCALAVIPSGTGNDFAKTVGVGSMKVGEILGLVAQRRRVSIDVGRVDDTYFLNSCGFGFDAAVLEASNKVRWLRGNAVYIYSALKQLFTYRGVDVAVRDSSREASRMLMVTVSNGQWLGGAFHIAPRASATDGKLDVALIRNSAVVERALLFTSATRGTHVRRPAVQQMQVPNITLEFSSPPSMEIDGELRHARSSTVVVECVPRALSVIAAPGALGD